VDFADFSTTAVAFAAAFSAGAALAAASFAGAAFLAVFVASGFDVLVFLTVILFFSVTVEAVSLLTALASLGRLAFFGGWAVMRHILLSRIFY
jgi:hypothetical protein